MIFITVETNAAMMDALRARIDSGSTAGYVEFYDGVRPAAPTDAPTGDLIATCILQRPCGSISVTTGDLVVATSQSGQILAASAPTWARIKESGTGVVMDCKVRLIGDPDDPEDPAELVVNAPSLSIGSYLVILTGSFTALAE